jgi:predicted TIM-barrel fold metal-dependent hydrolase
MATAVSTGRVSVHDAAQYVIEPPDLWTSRLPKNLAQRGPKVVQLPGGGEGWAFEDGAWIRPLGLNAAAGRGAADMADEGYTYSQLRPGMTDPTQRLVDMDLDGVDRAAIFPTFGMEVRSLRDPLLHKASVRAYNEALGEWAKQGQGRLDVQALIPLSGMDDAVAELEYVTKLGFRGIVFSGWPAGGVKPDRGEDRFWAGCAEAGLALNLVRGGQIGDRTPVAPTRYVKPGVEGVRAVDAPVEVRIAAEATIKNVPLAWIVLTGILERFPSLQVALIGVGAGWLRYCAELFDWNFRYAQFLAFEPLKEHPGEYMRRQVKATIDRERYVYESVDDAGARGLLWASHYPTHMTTWPESKLYISHLVGDVGSPRARLLLRENYEALYTSKVAARQI